MQKEEGAGGGDKAKEKRKRIKPLICLDFPLHRVISLEVTEIKRNVRLHHLLPCNPHFLFTEKWEPGRRPPCPHKGPQCPLQRGTRTPALSRSRLLPPHPGDGRPELEVHSQDDLIYRKDKDVV